MNAKASPGLSGMKIGAVGNLKGCPKVYEGIQTKQIKMNRLFQREYSLTCIW